MIRVMAEKSWQNFLVCVAASLQSGQKLWPSILACLPTLFRGGQLESPEIWKYILCLLEEFSAGVPLEKAILKCACPTPTPSPPPPATTLDPWNALGQIRIDNIGCTGTVMDQGAKGGSYYVMCAYHCIRNTSGVGTMVLRRGEKLSLTLLGGDQRADLSVLKGVGQGNLPMAKMADGEPAPGVKIWHGGWGIVTPGQKETGSVVGGPDSNGQIEMAMPASSGDSGGGIFREDNGAWVSAVCCGGGNRLWGGGVTAARALLSRAPALEGCGCQKVKPLTLV